jgi:hypothetical protein
MIMSVIIKNHCTEEKARRIECGVGTRSLHNEGDRPTNIGRFCNGTCYASCNIARDSFPLLGLLKILIIHRCILIIFRWR